MKKFFFMAATAALALSSCSSDELVQVDQPTVEDGAVSFSAYQGRATRAAQNNATKKLGVDGFGVFAYEQGTADWKNYVTSYNVPNFMFNQKVYGCSDPNGATPVTEPTSPTPYTEVKSWAYTPVKYFSNVPGAKHSFFAYAPWNENIEVKFSTTGPKIHYNMAERSYDLLWGHVKDAPAKTYQDLTKQDIDYKIDYTFEHTLTQVNVDLSYFADVIHNGTTDEVHTSSPDPSKKLAEGTKIIVRSVKLEGPIATEGDLDLATGKWAYTNVDESAFEKSDIVFVGGTSGDAADTPKKVFDELMILPPMEGKKVKIKVVYDVETIDENSNTELNNHIVTNKWESEELTLEKGHAYTYHLHIGMTSVKFNAEVSVDWTKEGDKYIDLPVTNIFPGLTAATVSSLPSYTSAPDASVGKYFDTTDNKVKKYNSAWEDTDENAGEVIKVESVWYQINASAAATEITEKRWFKEGKYYTNAECTDPAEGVLPADLTAGYYIIGDVVYKKD